MPQTQEKEKTKKSDNEKETIKGLKKKGENLEKENSELKEKIKKKNEEIENLKAIAGITGSNQPNTNGRESRSAPPASTNDTIGEGNIPDEIKRLTDKSKALKEQLEKLKKKNEEIDNLKAITGITGQGDNVSNQPNTNGRESSTYESETINRLKKIVENLDKENSELKEKFKENNGEIENLKAILKKKDDGQKEEIKRLTKENEQQRYEIKKLFAVKEANINLNEKIKKLEETQSQKGNTDRKQIEEKNKDINHLQQRSSEAEKKNLDLTQKIKDLETKLSQQEQENKDK